MSKATGDIPLTYSGVRRRYSAAASPASLSQLGGPDASRTLLTVLWPSTIGPSRVPPPRAASGAFPAAAAITACMFSMGVIPQMGSFGNDQP